MLSKKAQEELKISTRKLQLEVDEKNEIISVLKDELETTKEQSDKLQRENLQLLKDSKRVKFLQDENDFLQDKVGSVEKLEVEIQRLKERLGELDFLKLRCGELEEDRAKAQEESLEFEDKWKKAEAGLTRIGELEGELNKWKSFSHELENERDSIKLKLLESIEQETKLNATNKQIEDEVRRLRALVKSFEEQRDEEQASNSLAYLKQLDHQTTTQQHELEERLNELSIKNKEISDELEGNKKLISDLRQDLAWEKSLNAKLDKQLTSFTKQIKHLDKQYFPMQHATSVSPSSKAGAQSLSPSVAVTIGHDSGFQSINHDFNQISPQTNAQEALKDSSKLANGTGGQKKGEDEDAAATATLKAAPTDKADERREEAAAGETPAPLQPNRSMPIGAANRQSMEPESATSADLISRRNSATPTQSGDNVPTTTAAAAAAATPSADEEATNSLLAPLANGSQLKRQQQAPTIPTTVTANGSAKFGCSKAASSEPAAAATHTATTSALASSDTSCDTNLKTRPPESRSQHLKAPVADSGGDGTTGRETTTSSLREEKLNRAPAKARPGASGAKASQTGQTNGNFVRNALPSRSVNFGHSTKSAFLDRIRASVTATTTTNTTSSFNEQSSSSSRNILLTNSAASSPRQQQQQQQQQQAIQHRGDQRLVLNCMLDHQHSERCFVLAYNLAQAPKQQVEIGLHHGRQQQQHLLNGGLAEGGGPLRSSRQLNALIDPVSHERLMMSMLQRQQQLEASHNSGGANNQLPVAPLDTSGLANRAELSEQQIAHLASLHHQHYYHHLQHMHQLHQMHHQHYLHLHHHRMHHKYEQQQFAPGGTCGTSSSKAHEKEPAVNGPGGKQQFRQTCEPIYSGGSQFYARGHMDQVYANMAATNNATNERTRLVSNANRQNNCGPETPGGGSLRSSPARQGGACVSPSKAHKLAPNVNQYGLPQIDEMTCSASEIHMQNGKQQQQQSQRKNIVSPESVAKSSGKKRDLSSNGSPSSASSSPTSSTSSNSSNLSPSSASSSSSLNSLSTASTPAKPSSASSALRHASTSTGGSELNGRQFSVERELIGAQPMTATLLRVGSCRAASGGRPSMASTASHLLDPLIVGRQQHQRQQDASQMLTPARSQQPSMRTSKILNISQQSGCNGSAQPPQQTLKHLLTDQAQQQQQHLLKCTKNGLDLNANTDKLVNNLANIRLNDSLAFTSLRAPKLPNAARDGSEFGRAMGGSKNGLGQTSTSGMKQQLPVTLTSNAPANGHSDGGAGQTSNEPGANKSSVWFEYGCV